MSHELNVDAPEASVVASESSVAGSWERAGKPAAKRRGSAKSRSSSASSSASASSSSESSSSSARRVRANRANAKKSTGPRTDEGKKRSARNAVRHGLFCQDLILPGEKLVDFLRLRLGFHASLRATDALEFAIIERAVIAQWRLRRCQSAEFDLHRSALHRQNQQHMKLLMGGVKMKDLNLALNLLEEEDDDTATIPAPTAPQDAGESLATDLADPHSAIERLSRYEHRLEHHFFKALRELRALRKSIPPVIDDEFMAQIGAYCGVETLMQELRECEARERAANGVAPEPQPAAHDVNAPVQNEPTDAPALTISDATETDESSAQNEANAEPAPEPHDDTDTDESSVQNEAKSKVVLQMPEESGVEEGVTTSPYYPRPARSQDKAGVKPVADDARIT